MNALSDNSWYFSVIIIEHNVMVQSMSQIDLLENY